MEEHFCFSNSGMKKITMVIAIMALTYDSFAVTIETTVNLNVYYPEYTKIDLVCGQMSKAFFAVSLSQVADLATRRNS